MPEDKMVGWHHRLGGREFEQAPGVGYGQGNLACCSPWGCKELDTTESLNRTELNWGKEEATLGRGNSLNKILETGQFRAHSTAGVLGLDCDRAFPHILACHPCSSSTFSLFLSSLFLSSFSSPALSPHRSQPLHLPKQKGNALKLPKSLNKGERRLSDLKITVTEDEEMQIQTQVKLLILAWFLVTPKTLIVCKGKKKNHIQTLYFLLMLY